eukprot:1199420-Pyramimonas_sp.AAC.1
MAATIQRLGLPTYYLASGRTTNETTCKFVRQGKSCPGCPCSHKKTVRIIDRREEAQEENIGLALQRHRISSVNRTRHSRGRGPHP